MKKSIIGVIGISIDDNYKWKDSLISPRVTCSDEKIYEKCKQFIEIKYVKKVDYSKARRITGEIYGCDEFIYDNEKTIKIYFKNENTCVIESNQQVNEWFKIIVNILLLKEGYTFIHAAAVSKDNKALVLPSWGGVGKTASVSKLIRKGYKLLGDDMNIITAEGKIYPFPKEFVLYFYHKELFPEVFKEKGPKCGSKMNDFYEKIKPAVKKVTRCVPGVLAYARKHNPQASKVSPIEIFGEDVVSSVSDIKQIMWIERNKDENTYKKMDKEQIAAKATAVTLNEIMGKDLQAVLIMCGFYQINIKDVFEKMYHIYEQAFSNSITGILNVSTKEDVSIVADKVQENIKF